MAEKITQDLWEICRSLMPFSGDSDKKLGEIRRLIEAGADVNEKHVCESHRRNKISPLNHDCIFYNIVSCERRCDVSDDV